jgi:MBOAT, membrane-bound O-acyltransferase family
MDTITRMLEFGFERGLLELWIIAPPFVAYVGCASAVALHTRVVLIAIYLATLGAVVTAGTAFGSSGVWAVAGVGYFVVLTSVLFGMNYVLHSVIPSRLGLAFILCFTYVVVPSVVFGPDASLIIVLGWEMAFSAYSYFVEASVSRSSLTLRSCLTFILVDPTLVYVSRSQKTGPVRIRAPAATRILLGVGSIAFGAVLIEELRVSPRLAPVPLTVAKDSSGYVQFFSHYMLRVVAGYALHSGRASAQIGAMALLGYNTPERYNYPLLAHSPVDFWRRWNIYFGEWAKRYIFTPCALWMRRHGRRTPSSITNSLGIVITFAFMGFAHDFVTAARQLGVGAGGVFLFSLHAVGFLCWLGFAHLFRQLRVTVSRHRKPARTVAVLVNWVLLLHFLALTVWLGHRGLDGAGLSERVSEFSTFLAPGT